MRRRMEQGGACVGARSCPVPQRELSLLHSWNSVEVTGPTHNVECEQLYAGLCGLCARTLRRASVTYLCTDCFLLRREKNWMKFFFFFG